MSIKRLLLYPNAFPLPVIARISTRALHTSSNGHTLPRGILPTTQPSPHSLNRRYVKSPTAEHGNTGAIKLLSQLPQHQNVKRGDRTSAEWWPYLLPISLPPRLPVNLAAVQLHPRQLNAPPVTPCCRNLEKPDPVTVRQDTNLRSRNPRRRNKQETVLLESVCRSGV
jgi:hypothetical protein